MGDRKSLVRDGTPSGKPLLQKKHKPRGSDGSDGSDGSLDPDLDLDLDTAHDHDQLNRGRAYQNSYYSVPHPANRRPTSGTPRRPAFSRRSTLRSRSPATNARLAARKKYTYAAVFLVISLVSFCVQTELAAYVQHDLGWNKAYCMLYLTHGSWALLWPTQLLILRLQRRDMPWPIFWRKHVWLCRTTAQMVHGRTLEVPHYHQAQSPVRYMLKTTVFVTSALTVAGLSWYIAVDLTTPSDLTAIYNCSAFFAYAFSIPLLKEPFRLDKGFAVVIAIVGVIVVAYGDTKQGGGGEGAALPNGPSASGAGDDGNRFLGNVIIGCGSVLYGLYEVLYKRFACPPEGCSPGRGMVFANLVGSLIGCFTLLVLWFPLPLLHIAGIERFALPTGATAWWLFLSVVMNATFAGSFLVLISLTSPVLSSVASLLTIFIVAVSDWFLTGQPLSLAAIVGGLMIIVAFVMLSVSTWREMTEEERRRELDIDDADVDADDNGSDDDDASDKASSHND
ncbi:hypothetical protein M406DRAFT_348105 [Cryphonectria parasitica EP155]|uniref:EamA domain-containing protein n=1 Tax=Cryphonectria parasitica (strain ATCC 38755 / EP155) TaxID=660469 RepID=A0A9P4XTE3_CRYP1|nr:uncharacterized protein M406DRAFT_348105 [Cryphonectria parasitica EP155]KAF3760450.1 hypothetical protein M406DRAFT_348105 [Cryphonectria parasitica EP155]